MTDIEITYENMGNEGLTTVLRLGGKQGEISNVDGKKVQVGFVAWLGGKTNAYATVVMDAVDLNAMETNSFYKYALFERLLEKDRVQKLADNKKDNSIPYIGGIKLYEHLDETAYQLDEPAGGRVGYEITLDEKIGGSQIDELVALSYT